MKLKYFGTLACNAEKCWDVFCSFLLHQSAPSFNAQLGQWHLKLSCIDEVGQRSISTIDKPSIGHSYELWLLVTFMSHQNHRSPAWDPDATVFESLPCHPCPSMIHRTSTVHLYTVYLIFFYHDSFCIVLLCVRASSIGIQYIQWPSPNVNSLKWLWISLDQILAQAPLWCRNQNTGFPCSSADQRNFGLTTWKRPEVASTYQRNQEDCQDFIPIRSY